MSTPPPARPGGLVREDTLPAAAPSPLVTVAYDPASPASLAKLPPPSPPAPIVGIKRGLTGRQPHDLENVKSQKLHETANAKPLELNYRRAMPGAALKRNAAMIEERTVAAMRPRAETQTRAAAATKARAARPTGRQVQSSARSMPIEVPIQQPQGYVRSNGYHQEYPPPMGPVMVASHPDGYHPGVAYTQIMAQPAPRAVKPLPYGYYQTQAAPTYEFRVPVPGPPTYEPAHEDAPVTLYTDPHIPQTAAEARALWDKLHPYQKEEFMRFLQTQGEQAALNTTPTAPNTTPMEDDGDVMDETFTEAFESTEDAEMEEEHTVPTSDKGKGKAFDGPSPGDYTMDENPQPSLASPRSPVESMTNHFGAMLLSHIQESHEQMSKMMSNFVTQQNEVQERFRTVVAQEFRAVHSQVQRLQNPLPVGGRRHAGHKTAPVASHSQAKSASGATASAPPPTSPQLEAALTKLRSSVRMHMKHMLKFTTWAELVERQPPLTDAEIKAFGTRDSAVKCTEDNFRVDFIHEWKRLPLNLHARDMFVQNILKSIQGGAFDFDVTVIPLITDVHVERALDSHMEHCRRKYREAYNVLKWDSDDADDAREKTKQEEKLENEKKRKAVNSRKHTLLDTRLFVITTLGLQRHMALFDLLFARNMSGDETDGNRRKLPMAYRIVESRWQSEAFKTFLRALDAMYRKYWEKPRPGQRATGGNPPRTRISRPDGRVEDGHAPCGLWRNCYDEEWLRSLAPYQRRALKMVDAEYDFDLTPEFNEDSKMEDLAAEASEDEVEEEL